MKDPIRKGMALLGIPLALAACGGGSGGGGWIPPIGVPPVAEPAPPGVSAADKCKAFAGTSLAGASLKEATLVPLSADTEEYCKVTGTLHEALNFEVRLPTEWNKAVL